MIGMAGEIASHFSIVIGILRDIDPTMTTTVHVI